MPSLYIVYEYRELHEFDKFTFRALVSKLLLVFILFLCKIFAVA